MVLSNTITLWNRFPLVMILPTSFDSSYYIFIFISCLKNKNNLFPFTIHKVGNFMILWNYCFKSIARFWIPVLNVTPSPCHRKGAEHFIQMFVRILLFVFNPTCLLREKSSNKQIFHPVVTSISPSVIIVYSDGKFLPLYKSDGVRQGCIVSPLLLL